MRRLLNRLSINYDLYVKLKTAHKTFLELVSFQVVLSPKYFDPKQLELMIIGDYMKLY